MRKFIQAAWAPFSLCAAVMLAACGGYRPATAMAETLKTATARRPQACR